MTPLRHLSTFFLACLLSAPGLSVAQGFPSKPVTMIVAFSPGGPTDVLARVVANGLSKSLGQRVLVDNKAGAGGIVGTAAAARAAPDGYAILFAGDAALTVQPQLTKSASYDAKKDFTPLRVVASQANVLVANASKGIPDMATLIARAKARPSSISFASAGNGSPSHLIGALFEAQAGVDLLHVAYKGAAPAMTDLLGGQVDVMFVGMPVAMQNATRKELVLLAVTGDKRAPGLPNVPTFAELGIKSLGTETAIWWGLVAPAGLPADVATKLDSAIQAALKDPQVVAGLTAQGVDVLNLDAKTMTEWIGRDTAKWGKLIQDKKIAGD